MAARPPTVRSPTPTPKTLSRRTSAQSIRRDFRLERNPSVDSSDESPTISVTTPSSSSTQNTVYSDRDSKNSSPRHIAGLGDLRVRDGLRAPECDVHQLFSPSAPPQQPGDELLYDIASERRPDARIFSPTFQSAIKEAKGELRELSLAIWGCTAAHQAGTNLYALRQQGQSLSEFEPSRIRKVGLVGDSGVGKSSLINSLLDHPNLARSSGDGSACTCVVTEYQFRPTHHEEPYGIEVNYMTSEEVKELLDELLRTFKQCFIPAFNDVDSIQEQNEIREKSSKAWETLQSMFRDRPELTQDFLKGSTGDEASVLSTLQEWGTALLAKRPGGANTSTWSTTAVDVDDYTDKLDPFVRDPVDVDSPALWPFVRIIRIYLRASILQTGLILVDLPGLRNLNFARARAIEMYLRNCHEVFAVTTISRATTDPGVRDVIARTGRHRPLRIVCTKSEMINARETERTSSPDIAFQIRTWRHQIENLHLQMRRCEAKRRRGVPGALEEEVKTRDILNEIDFGLKKLLIERRNREVAHDLIEKYQGLVQLGDLKVFCVSNVDYFNHRHDEQNRAESRLELSGIVNLRMYCHKIPAEAQFAAAASYLEHEVPAFLGSLRQWSLAGSDQLAPEKADQLQEVLEQSEATLCRKLVMPSSEIHRAMTNLNYEFAASVVLPIRENRADWRATSVEISREWANWSASSYAAFCRKYGNSETMAVGPRSWNEELIRPMRIQLESNWGFFEEWVDECKADLIDTVGRVFDDICEPLKDYIDDASNTVGNLLDNVGARKECIFRIIDAGFDDLIESTSQIENDTLYGHDSSYTSDIMHIAYQACNQESGAGSDVRRKELINRHIQSCRLFPKLSTMVERNHRNIVRVTFDAVIGAITREVDNFVRDLRLLAGGVVEDEARHEAQRYPEFTRRLRVRLLQADRVLLQCTEAARDLRELGELRELREVRE